ncbi:DUF4188 domain-containing protein [Plantactinospora sp. KBS50]|uniref:DUF4188 domain-containing protein n=1 Tax=Plantactinospora sp. KBS50 TaxID=2024580 RepID=UPI000BAAC20F|nr:DUF4188 domain-containing protein [Plantactinospora sp. KBS50]ASW57482.1 transcriptional regulator [Plantactinospora sp. KBS50]
MAPVTKGRMTADLSGDFVVFLIGMRVNKPWKLHKWIPVAKAMLPMLRTLYRNRDLGMLGSHTFLGIHGPMLVQYWRSVEHLDRFARDTSLPHRPAWRAFNRRVGTDGDVGIWHETFEVRAGAYESLYANMPPFGLAAAGRHLPVATKGERAAERRQAGSGQSS